MAAVDVALWNADATKAAPQGATSTAGSEKASILVEPAHASTADELELPDTAASPSVAISPHAAATSEAAVSPTPIATEQSSTVVVDSDATSTTERRVVSRFYFATQSFEVDPQARAALMRIKTMFDRAIGDAQKVGGAGATSITLWIRGYTDSSGPKAYNAWLAYQRARAVRLQLMRLGVPKANMRIEGHGAQHYLESNTTRQGRQRNRRVDCDLSLAPKIHRPFSHK